MAAVKEPILAAGQTLAVFSVANERAARALLKRLEEIDKVDGNVEILDAAIAQKRRLGRVKVHQTIDTPGMKGARRGAAVGVVAGAILLGPAGAAIGGAAGGTLAGLHNRIKDIGIDDKFMRAVGHELEGRGRCALFVLYVGKWANSIGMIEEAVKRSDALLIHSTLSAEKAAALKALVDPAVKELGGPEVVNDYEVEAPPPAPVAAAAVAAASEEEAPAEPAAATPARTDDLTALDGIGDKTAAAFGKAGVVTFAQLAAMSEPDIRTILVAEHIPVPHSVGTWAMQASFAANGDWKGLMAFVGKTQEHRDGQKPAAADEPAKIPDDLTQINGIGPKAAKLLTAAGIVTYNDLENAPETKLRSTLRAGGMVAPGALATWPRQAAFAGAGDWSGLAKFNRTQAASAGKAASKSGAKGSAAKEQAAPAKPDDLTQLKGIGTRMSAILATGGVTTYKQLQKMKAPALREIVSASGALPPSSLTTWPTQASYAAAGDWDGLAAYNKA